MGQLSFAYILLLAVLKQSLAQDTTGYPVWVTNDYDCVIGCIKDQLGEATPPATQVSPSTCVRCTDTRQEQSDAALGCVRDACAQESAAGNTYQAHYIINVSPL